MKLTEELPSASYQIRSYTPGTLRINTEIYTHSVLISETQLQPWRPTRIEDITQDDFEEIIAQRPQVLLIGTGTTFKPLPPALLAFLYQKNIGVECLHTLAACSTFTLLVNEGRKVMAALCII